MNFQQIIHTQRKSEQDKMPTPVLDRHLSFGPRQANLVLIVNASSDGSGEPAQ